MSVKNQILVFMVLIVLAATMRFYRLGDWSFCGDELYTFYETGLFSGEMKADDIDKPFLKEYFDPEKTTLEDSQLYRLPQLAPVAYAVHWLDYHFFGRDEFGSRVLMAVIGSFNIGLLYLLGRPLLGDTGALVLSVLILCFPEHLFNSQNARMYSLAYLLISTVFLLGGTVALKRSVKAAVAIGPVAVLMILTHTLGGMIWGIVLAGVAADYFLSKRTEKYPISILLLFGLWSLLFVAFAACYILPRAAGWNGTPTWGYTPLHALMALVARVGWPVFLLAAVGTTYAFFQIREKDNAYWVCVFLASMAAVYLFPLKQTFYPWHSFIFTFPPFFLAARLIESIHSNLGKRDCLPVYRFFGFVWITFAAMLNLPATASYYQDGNRLDFRSACSYVLEHWQEGDVLASAFVGFAEHYLPADYPKQMLWSTSNKEYMDHFVANESESKGRLWIIDYSHRGGMREDKLRWLCRHAEFEAKFGKKRLDHIDNNVYVFLIDPRSSK